MSVEAVLFDWGGTLTPWRTIDPAQEWRVVAETAAPDGVAAALGALMEAAEAVWKRSRDEHRSATIQEICALAGVAVDPTQLEAYREQLDYATHTDPDAAPMLGRLRRDGLKVGLLSNTTWPRRWHDDVLARDGVLELFDGTVYSSELAWTKPHPEAFRAAMGAVGVHDPARCVFVGDRIFDDIYGANRIGMKAVLIPHSDVPASQLGHTEGEPDAVVERLSQLPDVLGQWR